MKKYLVKTTSVATDENKNFAGQVQICWIGKKERLCGMVGSHPEALHMVMPFNTYMAREYGYNRKDHAQRAYTLKHLDEDLPYWTVTAEIVEVEA